MDLDNQDIQQAPVDRFENSESYSEVSHINTSRDYVVVGGEKIAFPECLKGTLIQKLLILKAEKSGDWSDGSIKSRQRRVLTAFRAIADVQIHDEKFCMEQISSALVKHFKDNENTAYQCQGLFKSLLNPAFLNRLDEVTRDEQLLAWEINRHYTRFKTPDSIQRPSLADRYPSFGNDGQYVESIRNTAFVLHETMSEMRAEFATYMESERNELMEIFRRRPDLQAITTVRWDNAIHDTDQKRSIEILHLAALTLASSGKKNKHLLECLFLGQCYGTDFLVNGVACSEAGEISLTKGATHEYMVKRVQSALDDLQSQRHTALSDKKKLFSNGGGNQRSRPIRFQPFVPHPLALLIPFSWGEMQMYSFIFLTERAAPQSLDDFKIDDVQYYTTAGEKVSRGGTAIKLFKGRNGKVKSVIYKKTDPIYKIFNDLVSSYREAIDQGFSKASFEKPFDFSDVGFFRGGLGYSKARGSVIAPLLVSGTEISTRVQATGYVAWHNFLRWCAPRAKAASSSVGNPFGVESELKHAFFNASNLTQSAVKAAQIKDLSLPVATSENLRHPLSQEYWEELAENTQFHAKATRLNTYFLRNDSEKVTEILNDFAARHGEAQVELAEKLKSIMGSVELLDHKTASAALGLSESPHQRSIDEMLVESKAVDAITDTGFFKTTDSSVTYIIKSPRTAALMMAKMNHIDTSYDDLCFTNPNLVVAAIATRMMLAAVLENFSESDRLEAKQLIDRYAKDPDRSPFKFPDLAVSLGGFE